MHCRAQVTHWDGLPSDLLILILKKLVDSLDYPRNERAYIQAFLALRLVSKIWKEAASAYDGEAYVEPQKQTDLLDLIKVMPHIKKLRVKSRIAQYIQPVSAYTQLSSLSIECHEYDSEGLLDMSLLPMSLVNLEMAECGVNPNSFQNLSSMKLTCLELYDIQNSPTEKHELMQCLPRLQV